MTYLASRRVVRIALNPIILGHRMTDGYRDFYAVKRGLPPGAKFVGSAMNPETLTASLFFEHESFDEVQYGDPVPWFDVVYESLEFPETA